MVLVVWYYAWFLNISGGHNDLGDFDYYRLLTRSYKKGQLHLDRTPAPELLALKNPYDPSLNAAYRIPDTSFYNGRFYLYFGPIPALVLMLPYTLVTGREMSTGTAILVFCTAAFLILSLLWLDIRRRSFPQSRFWTAWMGVCALGFTPLFLCLQARGMWWELAIASSATFTTLALACVHLGLHARRTGSCVLAFGAAGLSLGLAIGSRPTALFAALMLLVPFWHLRKAGPPGRWRSAGMAAALPLAICGGLLMAHNYARFGNVFEFGQKYLLMQMTVVRNFGLDFFASNLQTYLLRPIHFTWDFPFVQQVSAPSRPNGQLASEAVGGIALAFPLFWLSPVAFAWAIRDSGAGRAPLRAFIGSVALCALGSLGVLTFFFAVCARYCVDFAPSVALLACIGLLIAESASRASRWRVHRIVVPIATVAVFVSVAMGILLGFDYHGRSLQRTNPLVWGRLAEQSTTLLANAGLLLGQLHGPKTLKVRFRQQPPGYIEPLWEALDPAADERVVIEHRGAHLIRFGFQRGSLIHWGRLICWEEGHTHTVVLQLPSLYQGVNTLLGPLRREVDFRERASVAIRFSGGIALHHRVLPLNGVSRAGGGRVSREFSGEVRSTRTHLFRDEDFDDVRPFPALSPGDQALKLRLIIPTDLDSRGEPLLTTGARFESDMVYLRPQGDSTVVVFEHFGHEPYVSRPLAIAPLESLDLEIELPSFAGGSIGQRIPGTVRVRLNHEEILRVTSDCFGFPEKTENIARNPFATTCAPFFRGWVLSAGWLREEAMDSRFPAVVHEATGK